MRCNFLTVIFVVMACFSLHAAENGHCGLDPQSPFIYVAEDAKVYNPDLIFVKQTDSINNHKKAAGVKKKVTPAPAENEITEHEPDAVVLPVFPLEPSSSSFLQGGRESATISQQQRQDEQQSPAKACRENKHQDIKKSDLSLYQPVQRQKLSIAATQYGMLTSFGSTSPPERYKVKGTR